MGVFLVMLVRFCKRERSIVIRSGPKQTPIQCWFFGKDEAELAELLEEVHKRAQRIDDLIAYPLKRAVGFRVVHPWMRTIGLMGLCIMPAAITQQRWLLLLCLVPVLWHIRRSVRLTEHPRLYRLALRSAFHRRWKDAMDRLTELMRTQPDYVPAYLLTIDLLAREGRCAEAAAVLNAIQGALNEEDVQAMQADLILRQRVWDRKRHQEPAPAVAGC